MVTGMKFIHMADAHIGSWRDERLQQANLTAFRNIIDYGLKENVDFYVIAGDLFNTALPSIDRFREITAIFKELSDKNKPIYLIPGSHDYSPAGKTMISILETAGLCVNVAKGKPSEDDKLRLTWTEDKNTQTLLSGIVGKQGTLEKTYYEQLDRTSLENEAKDKSTLFLFHSAITEFRPVQIKEHLTVDLSHFPKRIGYYAGGHVHYKFHEFKEDYGVFCYPGPIFPNSFSELEDLQAGSFCLVEMASTTETENKVVSQDTHHISYLFNGQHITMKREVATTQPVRSFVFDVSEKDPDSIVEEVLTTIKEKVKDEPAYFSECIATVRLKGTLARGKISDISFEEIYSFLYENNAAIVLKSTTQLKTKQFEEIAIETQQSPDELHTALINEHVDQKELLKREGEAYSRDERIALSKEILDRMDITKAAGETNDIFQKRIIEELDAVLKRKKVQHKSE
jgi:DNA repair exonuclease SbcCD nuclease subunit